jgi:UDP-N-acetylglucosamine transferase subunit ALG13
VILVTAGTQLPFDRLMQIVDELSPSLNVPVFAQTGISKYQPVNAEWAQTLPPKEFEAKFTAASVIVAHAGIGTILTAQRLKKPLILFPREARFGEHRNDHQLATCKQLQAREGIYVARTAEELQALLVRDDLVPDQGDRSLTARQHLVDNVAAFLGRLPTKRKG